LVTTSKQSIWSNGSALIGAFMALFCAVVVFSFWQVRIDIDRHEAMEALVIKEMMMTQPSIESLYEPLPKP
jgi:hypothetical protein